MAEQSVYAFEVGVRGKEWSSVVNARTRGQAKSLYHLRVSEPWPNIRYTEIRCRKVGVASTSKEFVRNALYRGLPHLRCGQRVCVGTGRGVVVGHNASANFDVLFDEDSPRYPGLRLNVHPGELSLEQTNHGGSAA